MDEAAIYDYTLEQTAYDVEVAFHNDPDLTLKILIDKYREYMKWWKINYGHIDKEFLAKDRRLTSISKFARYQEYNHDRKLDKSPLNHYLFGIYNPDKLQEYLNKLYKTIGHGLSE